MKRPFSVTIMLWMVLSLTVWSGLRLVTAIQWWPTLLEFATQPGPLYITISAGVWLASGISLLWGMWQTKAWIRYALLGAGSSFSAWYWGDRLLLQLPHVNWPFAILANSLLLIILFICVFVPSTKIFFTKSETHD